MALCTPVPTHVLADVAVLAAAAALHAPTSAPVLAAAGAGASSTTSPPLRSSTRLVVEPLLAGPVLGNFKGGGGCCPHVPLVALDVLLVLLLPVDLPGPRCFPPVPWSMRMGLASGAFLMPELWCPVLVLLL